MRTYYIRDVDQPDWTPLRTVAELLMSESCDLPVIEPDHFMYMAGIQAKGQPDIHLYKHYYTRRYLNLDDHGHAYQYVPSQRELRDHLPAGYMGRYRLLPDLATALANLDVDLVDNCAMDPDQRAKLVRRQAIKAAQQRRAATPPAD